MSDPRDEAYSEAMEQIERLEKRAKERAIFLNGLAAEIERLKETNEILMRNATQDAEREHRKDVLITELADWIYQWRQVDEDEALGIIQRAREATR